MALNVKDIIESGLLEAYVLGNATSEEAAQVAALCAQHPELQEEVERIERTLMAYAAAKSGAPAVGSKDKLMAQLKEQGQTTRVLPLRDRKKKLYRYGIAACIAALAGSLVYNVRLQNKVEDLHLQVTALSSSQSFMAQEMEIQKASYTRMQENLTVVADPHMRKVMLKGMGSMEGQAAAIHWNADTREVFFSAGSMTPPAGKQYQLWAIVGGKPVDAGTIGLEKGSIFQKMRSIPEAQAFAVTIENLGGSAAPTLGTMCLLGNT